MSSIMVAEGLSSIGSITDSEVFSPGSVAYMQVQALSSGGIEDPATSPQVEEHPPEEIGFGTGDKGIMEMISSYGQNAAQSPSVMAYAPYVLGGILLLLVLRR